jgi:hypothetical protein
MTAWVKTGKAQNVQIFSDLPPVEGWQQAFALMLMLMLMLLLPCALGDGTGKGGRP